MKKKLLFFSAIFLIFLEFNFNAIARGVSSFEVKLAATNYLQMENSRPSYFRINTNKFNLSEVFPIQKNGLVVGYVCELKPDGFIIFSADTKLSPVVFICYGKSYYSVKDDAFLKDVIDLLADETFCINENNKAVNDQFVKNEDTWYFLLSDEVKGSSLKTAFSTGSIHGVYPMTASKWGQGAPYNNYTPRIDDQATPTGCTATALAQVMYYWKYPSEGQGSNSYDWTPEGGTTQTLSADFNHPYYWDKMVNHYSGSETDEQKDAVARLMSDVGISVNMNYQLGGSGAWHDTNHALVQFFKYSDDLQNISSSNYSSLGDFAQVLVKNVQKGRPIPFAMMRDGGGHEVVIDGYRVNLGEIQFHLNLGWNGSCDGFYVLGNVYPCGGSTGYNNAYYALINVYPSEINTFTKHFGGIDDDGAYAVEQTSDRGYVIAGWSNSFSYGGYDFLIFKIDSKGNKVWRKHFGSINGDEQAFSIQQTSDGGFIVAGYSTDFSFGGKDFFIIKLDKNGNKLWKKHYGGSGDDVAYSIEETLDGGYIVAGYSTSFTYGSRDILIFKLDSNGNKVWRKHYGGLDDDVAYSIGATKDGGYIVAGASKSFTYGDYDILIFKLDSNGNKVWRKHYGGTASDSANSIHQTEDGGYVVAGGSSSFSYGERDFLIYKLDENGNKVWKNHFGSTGDDVAYSVQETSDGCFVVAGYSSGFSNGGKDILTYKIYDNGEKIFSKNYGGADDDIGYAIQETRDGGILVAGISHSLSYGSGDFVVYKFGKFFGNDYVINISDPNFKAFLVDNYDTNGDGEIELSEALSVKTMDTPGSYENPGNIENLAGIENFRFLERLNCEYEKLTTLNLSHNRRLEDLNCQYNQISAIDVSQNFELVSLSCSNNPLNEIDITNNKNLTTLRCNFCSLTSLNLTQNTKLLYLYCYDNQISNLDLSHNTNLQRLICGLNPLTSLDLTQNKLLNYINCHGAQLTDIPDVTGCTNLQYFYCDHNSFGEDDCDLISQIESMGLNAFQYNPQADGTNLDCSQ